MSHAPSLATLVLAACGAGALAPQAPPQSAPASSAPAGSIEAVADRVAEAFDTHLFVLVGSTHGGKKPADFVLTLLSRPAIQQRVTDVLVEWANPVHQKTVDRYLLALEDVPLETLQRAWFDTDSPDLWARLRLIPEFYARVRAINEKLEPARRIRVVGGCEPIEWTAVRKFDDLARYPYKTNWAVHALAEHFARERRRCLVVYGDAHIRHKGGSLESTFESEVDAKQMFVVGSILDLKSNERDRVARLGDVARPFFTTADRFPSAGPYPKDLFYAEGDALASYVDAVAYLGPEADVDLARTIAFSPAQEKEKARRDAIKGDLKDLMKLRFGHRKEWFLAHPDDLAKRPD